MTHCHLRQAIPVAHAPSALAGVVEDHVKDHLPTASFDEFRVPQWDNGDNDNGLMIFIWVQWWFNGDGDFMETHIWARCVWKWANSTTHTKKNNFNNMTNQTILGYLMFRPTRMGTSHFTLVSRKSWYNILLWGEFGPIWCWFKLLMDHWTKSVRAVRFAQPWKFATNAKGGVASSRWNVSRLSLDAKNMVPKDPHWNFEAETMFQPSVGKHLHCTWAVPFILGNGIPSSWITIINPQSTLIF